MLTALRDVCKHVNRYKHSHLPNNVGFSVEHVSKFFLDFSQFSIQILYYKTSSIRLIRASCWPKVIIDLFAKLYDHKALWSSNLFCFKKKMPVKLFELDYSVQLPRAFGISTSLWIKRAPLSVYRTLFTKQCLAISNGQLEKWKVLNSTKTINNVQHERLSSELWSSESERP